MKITHLVLGLAVAARIIGSGTALADRGHGRVSLGVNLGVPVGPWYYPPYYYPYAYPYPPVVTLPAYPNVVPVQPSAPVYIEKGDEAAGPSAQPSSYWYYCTDPQGYYPYIKECQTGWLTVVPQAPAQPQPR